VQKGRRRFRRMTVRVLVDYTGPEGPRFEYATTLGAGGLFIQTEEPLEKGAILLTRFRLSGRKQLHEIPGRVVWVRPPHATGENHLSPGMGIEFTDPAIRSQLAQELEQLQYPEAAEDD